MRGKQPEMICALTIPIYHCTAHYLLYTVAFSISARESCDHAHLKDKLHLTFRKGKIVKGYFDIRHINGNTKGNGIEW
jgi:hypothetical protein